MSAMTPSWSSASSIAAPGGLGAGQEETDGVVGRQRRHGPDGLAADPQPLAARGEEPQTRAAAQQILGHLGGGGDDVLAVVEHDQQVLVADQLGEPVRVRQVEGGGDRRRNAGGITDRRQLDQAPAEAQTVGHGPPDLQGQPRLAHPAGADQRDEAMLGEQRPEVAHLRVAADQRCQRLGDARVGRRAAIGRGAGAAGRRGQRGVVGEDRRLQPAQLGPRFEAELLAEELTALLEDPERVGLSPGAVEREHQQPTEPLAQRMGGDELLELDDRPVGDGRAGARGRAVPRSARAATRTTG